MRLSLIIPSYNRPAKTARAVQSVVSQEIDCEIVVVDDGSIPPLQLPSSLAGRVKMVRLEANSGAGAARNAGLAAASGDIVGFLDSDDVLLPGTLERRLEDALSAGILSAAGSRCLFACGWLERDAAERPMRTRIPRPSRETADFFAGCWFSPGSAILANARLFTGPEGRFDESLRRLEDFDLFARLASAGLALVAQPVIGVGIEVGGKRDSAAVRTAIESIQGKLRHARPRNAARGRAYLAYEQAHLLRAEGRLVPALLALARSLVHFPRLRLYPGPGWEVGQAEQVRK